MKAVEYIKKVEKVLEGKHHSWLDNDRRCKLEDLLNPLSEDDFCNVVAVVTLYFNQEKLMHRLNEDWKLFDKYEDYSSAFSFIVNELALTKLKQVA